MAQFAPQPGGLGPIFPISSSLIARRHPVFVAPHFSSWEKFGSQRYRPRSINRPQARLDGKLSRRAWNLETVSRAAHRLQIPRILRIGLDLLANAPHIYVHRSRSHKTGIAPHRVQQMVAAENTP